MPKRFALSGAGEILEKHMLEKMNTVTNTHSSRNSSCFPSSQSHKASIIQPKISRRGLKKSPVSKPKPYSYNSNFQCNNVPQRSRNPSKTNSYFTQNPENIRLSKASRQDSRSSKVSDGFKEVDMFTFAKQTPNPKSSQKNVPTPVKVAKTPTYKKAGHQGNTKSSVAKTSYLASTNTKYSQKARSSEKQKALNRQITSQASKKLSYTNYSNFTSKRNTVCSKNSSINDLKTANSSTHKHAIIQSMLTNKLSNAKYMRVKVKQEPTVKKDIPKAKIGYNTHSGNTNYVKSSYVPKYRESYSREKLRKDLEKVQKVKGVSRNGQMFSPIISMSEKETEGSKDNEAPRIKECRNIQYTSPPRQYTSSFSSQFNESDVQKLIKINLDLVQSLVQSIEASKSLVDVLTHNEFRGKEELNEQIRLIEELTKKNSATKCLSEINTVINNLRANSY